MKGPESKPEEGREMMEKKEETRGWRAYMETTPSNAEAVPGW